MPIIHLYYVQKNLPNEGYNGNNVPLMVPTFLCWFATRNQIQQKYIFHRPSHFISLTEKNFAIFRNNRKKIYMQEKVKKSHMKIKKTYIFTFIK
jgi:hypothetical protein